MDQKKVHKFDKLKNYWSSNSEWFLGCLKYATLISLLLIILTWLYTLQNNLFILEKNFLMLHNTAKSYERIKRDGSCACSPGYPGSPGLPGIPVNFLCFT